MLSGRIFESLMVTGGLTVLNPKLTDTGIAATNNRNFVGIPDYKSNILAEYHLPKLTGAFLNFDWQHVGRRAIDDINSEYTPQYNTFDFGVRYTTQIPGESDHLARHGKQRDQCALLVDLRPGQHHGAEHRQLSRAPGRAAVDHGLHAVRFLRVYEMVIAFSRIISGIGRRRSDAELRAALQPATDHLSGRQSDARVQAAGGRFTCQTGIQVKDMAMGSVDAGRQITAGGQACDLYAPADYLDIDLFMKPAGYANFDIVFAQGKMVLAYSANGLAAKKLPPSPNPAALSIRRTRSEAAAKWYEILTMPGVAIGGGNPFLDPGAYRAPMIFQLAEEYYKVPNLYNNMLGARGSCRAGASADHPRETTGFSVHLRTQRPGDGKDQSGLPLCEPARRDQPVGPREGRLLPRNTRWWFCLGSGLPGAPAP